MSERTRRVGSTNAYVYLANNGPATRSELPGEILNTDKNAGVRKFNLQSSYRGNSMQGGGQKIPVWYIEGKHSAKSVVQTWIGANPLAVEKLTARAIHQRCEQDEFRQAVRELLDPDFGGGHGPGTTDKACPFCGDDEIASLPIHLPNCDKRS